MLALEDPVGVRVPDGVAVFELVDVGVSDCVLLALEEPVGVAVPDGVVVSELLDVGVLDCEPEDEGVAVAVVLAVGEPLADFVALADTVAVAEPLAEDDGLLVELDDLVALGDVDGDGEGDGNADTPGTTAQTYGNNVLQSYGFESNCPPISKTLPVDLAARQPCSPSNSHAGE